MSRPTMFQIKEAIVKNVCAPDEEEWKELQTSKLIRTSTRCEGDAEVGMVLLIGIATLFRYKYDELHLLTSVDKNEYIDEYLTKFRERLKVSPRFKTKVRLVLNYLRIKYGVSAVLPALKR